MGHPSGVWIAFAPLREYRWKMSSFPAMFRASSRSPNRLGDTPRFVGTEAACNYFAVASLCWIGRQATMLLLTVTMILGAMDGPPSRSYCLRSSPRLMRPDRLGGTNLDLLSGQFRKVQPINGNPPGSQKPEIEGSSRRAHYDPMPNLEDSVLNLSFLSWPDTRCTVCVILRAQKGKPVSSTQTSS